MPRKTRSFTVLVVLGILSLPSAGDETSSERGLLWREPADLASRNLYYGPGGEKHQPHGPFTFVEEDLDGTNPKYVVRDQDNVKWTVKLGIEARPETAASRLVWAVGYFVNEDYFLEDLQVAGVPKVLKRGRNLVGPDGSMHAARLKRHLEGEKAVGNWQWRDDPFTGTRELSGLKVMMALINNWDLKESNNKLYAGKSDPQPVYMVSDLGASFGANGLSIPFSRSKGDLPSYVHSRFIGKVTPEYVSFATPHRPALIYAFLPFSYFSRIHMDGLVHRIPREDVRWIAHLLSGLSSAQIRDAFRASGYEPRQVEAFANVVQERISELSKL